MRAAFRGDYSSQSGQVGIIVLLIMVVMLTIGLSVASRSTNELFLAQQQAESARVFNAAEAGIEQALSGLSFGTFTFSDGRYSGFEGLDFEDTLVDLEVREQQELEIRVPEMISIRVDLENSSAGNQLIVNWSRETDCAAGVGASLMASVFYEGSPTRVARYFVEGCSRTDSDGQGDSFAAHQAGEDGYSFRTTIPLENNALFAHLTPLYDDTHLRVSAAGLSDNPAGYLIRSEARSEIGDETRIVEVTRSLDSAASIFDFALYSGDGLIKAD